MKRLLYFFVISIPLLAILKTNAQPISYDSRKQVSDYISQNPAERIYVHTDRAMYADIDTVWFKMYYSNAQTNLLVRGLNNVYAELVSAGGEIVIRDQIAIVNGLGTGDFILANRNLPKGDYYLRAYSNYQRNFGEAFIFHKKIRIINVADDPLKVFFNDEDSIGLAADVAKPNIDIQFLPEGGTFVSGVLNVLAYKAVMDNGKPINVSGRVVDGNGELVAFFESMHEGMGKLNIVPEKGQKYFALVDGSDEKKIALPECSGSVLMSVNPFKKTSCELSLRANESLRLPYKLNVIVAHRGTIKKVWELTLDSRESRLELPYEELNDGINQLTLADLDFKPISERLVFIRKETAANLIITTDKDSYARREKVTVGLSLSDEGVPLIANLSLSVSNNSQVPDLGVYTRDIRTYTLLDSELKGRIHQPGYYFKDDSISTYVKLDLLMLTQGWRKYVWNDIALSGSNMEYEREQGIVVKGKVKTLLRNKKISNGKVTAVIKDIKGDVHFIEKETDKEGSFRINPLILPESFELLVQAKNKKNRRTTEIVGLTSLSPPAPVDSTDFVDAAAHKIEKLKKPEDAFSKMAFNRYMQDKAENPEEYSIMMDDIDVLGQAAPEEETDGHYRIYGSADKVIKVDTNGTYTDFLDLVEWEMPQMSTDRDNIWFKRFQGKAPLFIIDGFEVSWDELKYLNISDIDKVELIYTGGSMVLFGSRGANGVVAVYTKRGETISRQKYVAGVVTDRLKGYANARVFYSPIYEDSKKSAPDHRATLHWEPLVNIDSSGTANVSFYTSDDAAPALIRVEGITSDGRPVAGMHQFKMKGY